MKVFISWSGPRSKAVAEVLDEWIQCVLQAVDPWMSSKDIDRGSLWFSELSDQLAETKLGIVCLTSDNKNRPWILFESGALAKGLSSARVCTFLIDLQPTDVENPLAQFNHSFPTKDGVFDLLRTINTSLSEKGLKETVLAKVFETYWPQFETEFQRALDENQPEQAAQPRSSDDVLSEVLTSVRRLDKRLRDMELATESQVSVRRTREKLASERFSMVSARNLALEMSRHGMPHNVIFEKLIDQGVPERAISHIFDALASSTENTSMDDERGMPG